MNRQVVNIGGGGQVFEDADGRTVVVNNDNQYNHVVIELDNDPGNRIVLDCRQARHLLRVVRTRMEQTADYKFAQYAENGTHETLFNWDGQRVPY